MATMLRTEKNQQNKRKQKRSLIDIAVDLLKTAKMDQKTAQKQAQPKQTGPWSIVAEAQIYLVDPRIVTVPVIGTLCPEWGALLSGAPARKFKFPAAPGVEVLVVPNAQTNRPWIAHIKTSDGIRLDKSRSFSIK